MTADRREQATLVALLRTRPDGMTWPEIMTEVVAAGNATDLWTRTRSATLIEALGERDPVEQAAEDITAWAASGLTFLIRRPNGRLLLPLGAGVLVTDPLA
jgi:DNA processing protein